MISKNIFRRRSQLASPLWSLPAEEAGLLSPPHGARGGEPAPPWPVDDRPATAELETASLCTAGLPASLSASPAGPTSEHLGGAMREDKGHEF